MQDLSFDFRDPVWEFNGLRFAVQLFTFENVYGLERGACDVSASRESFSLRCRQLTWAGGQEQADGEVTLTAKADGARTVFAIEARMPRVIRCIKLALKGVPSGPIVNLREADCVVIPADGLRLTYPSGWRDLYTPLVVLRVGEGQHMYFRSLDTQVRQKRFALLPQGDCLDVELIWEEMATKMQNVASVPAWEVGLCGDPLEIYREHNEFTARAYDLLPWESRPDVPAWARQISLVAAIHCRHWTGYVFNDYARVLQTVKWLAQHIGPERILVYLPGWEGRYYWRYGDYCPDPALGGETGFSMMAQGVRDLGAHLMPMFGINIVNQGLENYEQWGAPATFLSPGGFPSAGSVDWDSSRHFDHGCMSMVNPGAPTWQNRLVDQITGLAARYRFDGVYLDISAHWWNDPRHEVYAGTVNLIRRLRERHSELLIAGEGWYDGIGSVTPMIQSGHTEGVLHWHDEPYPDFFERYHRSFAHLCLGDPGRGSTGVHELGCNLIQRAPLRKAIIPTVTIVEDTIEKAPDRVLAIIEDAKHYAEKFVAPTSSQIPALDRRARAD